MATTTANSAKRANETKNAANTAASVATKNAAESKSRIIVAGIPKPSEKAKPEPTAEERAAALQKEIEERTKQLQAALTDLARKKELNDNRTKFLSTLENLAAAEEKLNNADEFGSEPCKIAFQGKPDGYRWDTIFTIGNAELQKEFIKFIREKIRAKVDEIEAELIK